MKITTFVLADDAQGAPSILTFDLDVSQGDIDEGKHYDTAMNLAREEGYEGVMRAFDVFDQSLSGGRAGDVDPAVASEGQGERPKA